MNIPDPSDAEADALNAQWEALEQRLRREGGAADGGDDTDGPTGGVPAPVKPVPPSLPARGARPLPKHSEP